MRKHGLKAKLLVPSSFLLIAWPVLTSPVRAQIPGDWWPDPTTHRGLSVWVTYSREYDALYSNLDQNPDHDQLVEQQLVDLAREGVEVVFVALSTPHLQSLSNREDSVTRDVQSFLNRLNAREIPIRACAAILSDNFIGNPAQLDRFTLVDHLVNFNRNRVAGDAGFRCVATDLEMPEGSRSSRVYDLWKQFHLNMKNRIADSGSNLRLLAWIQGPDFLITRMDNPEDRAALMERENIAPDPSDAALFTGAIRYFTTQGGVSIFDAVIPMWYFAPRGPYARRLQHNFDELQGIEGDKPFLIAGIMIRNDTGTCCVDRDGNPVCIRTRGEYDARLDFNDTFRTPPSSFIGTGVFKWPVPEDWNCTVSAGSAHGESTSCGVQ